MEETEEMSIKEAVRQLQLGSYADDTKVYKLATIIIEDEGSDREKNCIRFGLVPTWAMEQAETLLNDVIEKRVGG